MKILRTTVVWSVIILIIVLLVGLFTFINQDPRHATLNTERNKGKSFPPAKTIFSWDNYLDASRSAEYIDFENKLTEYMHNKFKDEMQEHIGFFFVDLNRNWQIAFHEDHEFIPASLLKTPMMMAYFKEAEYNPTLLDSIINSEEFDLKEFEQKEIHPSLRLKNNTDYKVRDLIKQMITLSDNRADYLLFKNLDAHIFKNVFTDLGIQVSSSPSSRLEFTPKEFSTYFYVLYNNLYLNQQYTTEALEILKETKYADGLRAGVPKEVTIAHKFGLRISNTDYDEVHDCGIIYFPQHPYILCVMTLGHNIQKQEKEIQEISRMFYEFEKSLI